MKRKLEVEEPTKAGIPAPTKSDEKDFEKLMSGMIHEMATSFNNQTFKQLNKGTVNKFEDSSHDCKAIVFNDKRFDFKDKQTGNYASIFLSLSRKSKRKLLKRFSNKRIDAAIRKVLGGVNTRNQNIINKKIGAVTGIDPKSLIATEGLKSTTNALYEESAQWAKRLRDNALESFTANSLRGMSMGMSVSEVIEEFKLLEGKTVSDAKMVARTQISTFNSLLTKARAQNLGITRAIWRSSEDERVRHAHDDRNGKEFDLSVGLYSSIDGKTLLPGTDYNCRCDYELIIE